MWWTGVFDRAVLGEDGDPALALDVVAVHHPLGQMLELGESPGLHEELSTSVVLPWSTCAMIAMVAKVRAGGCHFRCVCNAAKP
jgi:hypothetical protein